MSLTDTAIRNSKPSTKRQRMFDGGGMYLEVSPAGGKLWRLKYRFDGKGKLLALGKYPEVSLKEARDRREEAKKLLANDIDPSVTKKAKNAARYDRAENSFEVIAREWFNVWSKDKVKTTADHAAARLRNDILPLLGNKPIASITTPDILAALRRLKAAA